MKSTIIVRVFTFLLLSVYCLVAWSQGSWEIMETPSSQHLRSVYFTDSLYGWAVGDTGTIIHTNDGGDTWIQQDAGTDNKIVHVFFLNRQLGWASSWNFEGYYGTLILKTTDGGNTWTHHPYPDENLFMNCILYRDSIHGWMGGSPHAIVRTNDGGQSWEQAAIDTTALAFFPVLNIYFYNDQYAYACGGMFDIAGVTWSTSNGGESWQPISNAQAPADEVHGLHMFDSISVLGAGGDPDLGYGVGMIRTSDGGTNWIYEELSMAGNAFDLDFRNETEAWAPLGPSQKMIYSLDAGTTWTLVPTPASTSIFDMIFTDSLHGWGVGYNGAVIRYVPKTVGINEGRGIDNITFNVFPNPASDIVTIDASIQQDKGMRWETGALMIVDQYGKTVKSILFEDLPAVQNIVKLDLTGMPAGLYVLNLTMEGEQATLRYSRKLLLR
ncbi:MAG: YCF48-related protein [Bacteroidales bacterium]|nr:YCF48-related protein [Bacteroidales bacterium]